MPAAVSGSVPRQAEHTRAYDAPRGYGRPQGHPEHEEYGYRRTGGGTAAGVGAGAPTGYVRGSGYPAGGGSAPGPAPVSAPRPGSGSGTATATATATGSGSGYSEHWGTGAWAQQRPPYGHGGVADLPRQRRAPRPGPRHEDVAAFDSRAYAGAPYADGEPVRPSDADEDPEEPEEADAEERRKRAPKGRTFTGVAAAAVTTVLAVVVAGQVAEGPRTRDEAAASGDVSREDGAASRSQGRPTPDTSASPGAPAARAPKAPASLHEQLSGRFPLKETLALSGAFTTVGGTDKGPGKGAVVRYRVDVEKGLPLDGDLFTKLVHETLNDPRSWGHDGSRTFERVSSGPSDFTLTLASPGTTDVWCAKSGLDTSVDHVSCDSASTDRVMINAFRWAQGASTFGDDMLGYRQMLINHEVGHRLGRDHAGCSKDGALAPVMMQQTKYLSTNGATCKPNPWVKP